MSASGPSGPLAESDTVKSNCNVPNFGKMIKYSKNKYRLLVYLTSFTVFFWRY